MLTRGLAATIEMNITDKSRFVDLFAGSGAVSCYVSENFRVPVLSNDLQTFSLFLSGSITCRTIALPFEQWGPLWIAQAISMAELCSEAVAAAQLQNRLRLSSIGLQAEEARRIAGQSASPFVRAYGGWYFSPWQAILLDCLRKAADPVTNWFQTAVATTIQVASRCAASPGHTAQPFKADTRAAPFLYESWNKDIIAHATEIAAKLSRRYALRAGMCLADDANKTALSLNEGDLVFLDPPYSSVHYSRFYHVLESLARDELGETSGAGRYPPSSERPSSDFSIPTRAKTAIQQLLQRIAAQQATAILTFPTNQCSNGLAGSDLASLASCWFSVTQERHISRFSTLGGDKKHRSARQDTEELILTLQPLH